MFHRRVGIALVALGACSGGGGPAIDATPSSPDAIVDGAPAADVDLPQLHGSTPSTPKPLIAFTATNRDGAARTETALMGHPTVIWFYPAAFTGA